MANERTIQPVQNPNKNKLAVMPPTIQPVPLPGQQTGDVSLPKMFEQTYDLEKTLQGGFQQLQGQVEQTLANVNEMASSIGTVAYLDQNAIIGEIQKGYSEIEAGITNAALSSVNKRMMELDSYLGSSSSDARAAVRFRMAGEVTNGLMRESFQAIAQVKEQELDRITTARLNVAQANTGILNARTNVFSAQANAITNLMAQSANLYGAQAEMMMGLTTARLDAANAEANRALQREELAQNYSLAMQEMRQQDAQFKANLSLQYDELSQQDRQFADNLAMQYAQLKQQERQFNKELQFKEKSFLEELGLKQAQLDFSTEQDATANEVALRNSYVAAGNAGLLGGGFNNVTSTGYGASGSYTYTTAVRAPVLSFDEWVSGKTPVYGQFG